MRMLTLLMLRSFVVSRLEDEANKQSEGNKWNHLEKSDISNLLFLLAHANT